ncbi:MAG: hypothetical protein MN733_42335 [Nitrososphaera sp.]|nr:hypothetical protein [Nitrososphaera sp.]
MAALVALAVMQMPSAFANHETINPSLVAPEKDRYYSSDRVTYNLTFFYGNPGGHNDLEGDGYTVGYEVHYHQQKIDPYDRYIFNQSAGLSGGPPQTNNSNLFPINHDLTAGTWRISFEVFDRDNPPELLKSWFKDIDVYPLSQPTPPEVSAPS